MLRKFFILFLIILGWSTQEISAGDWTERYLKDAFGDSDYSQPVYTVDLRGTTNVIHEGESCILGLLVKPADGFAIYRAFLQRGGDLQRFYTDTQVFVKLSNGKKFQIPCDVEDGELYLGKTIQEYQAILDILNKGHFTLVIRSNNGGYVMTCTFHIGDQTTGIKNLVSPISSGHEAQGQPDTYKGSIGKNPITMQLRAATSSSSNPGVFPVSGKYWYGNGSNGKMTLKGTLTYKAGGIGVYKLDEFDSKGKKCGSFVLNEKTDVKTYVTTITGKMTNAKGTSYNVSLKRN